MTEHGRPKRRTVFRFAISVFGLLLAPDASAQQAANWQELALRAQQNATTEQMIANGMLSALQAEIAELKGQLTKAQQPGKPEPQGPPVAPLSSTGPGR